MPLYEDLVGPIYGAYPAFAQGSFHSAARRLEAAELNTEPCNSGIRYLPSNSKLWRLNAFRMAIMPLRPRGLYGSGRLT